MRAAEAGRTYNPCPKDKPLGPEAAGAVDRTGRTIAALVHAAAAGKRAGVLARGACGPVVVSGEHGPGRVVADAGAIVVGDARGPEQVAAVVGQLRPRQA